MVQAIARPAAMIAPRKNLCHCSSVNGSAAMARSNSPLVWLRAARAFWLRLRAAAERRTPVGLRVTLAIAAPGLHRVIAQCGGNHQFAQFAIFDAGKARLLGHQA